MDLDRPVLGYMTHLMHIQVCLFFPREAQLHREKILNKLTTEQQEETAGEEERIAKAVAEWSARQAQLQKEEEERKAAMLKSIAEHRDHMVTRVCCRYLLLHQCNIHHSCNTKCLTRNKKRSRWTKRLKRTCEMPCRQRGRLTEYFLKNSY